MTPKVEYVPPPTPENHLLKLFSWKIHTSSAW
jgi:hypothetical protein